MREFARKQRKNQITHQGCSGVRAMPWEMTYVDMISSEEVRRRLKELRYKEESERIEKIYSEVPCTA